MQQQNTALKRCSAGPMDDGRCIAEAMDELNNGAPGVLARPFSFAPRRVSRILFP